MTDMIQSTGIVEYAPEIAITDELPSAEIAQMLRISADEPVCAIRRTRYSEAGAICSSVNYIPAHLADELDAGAPPSSIFRYFEENKGVTITRSTTRIILPRKDDPITAEFRKIKEIPIIGLKQLQFDSKGNPVLYSIDYFRCDLFDFSVTRIRQR